MHSVYGGYVKRILDVALSLSLLVILAPLLAAVAVLVKLDSPGPAMFIQDRLGFKGRIFRLFKFRTMTHRHRSAHYEIIGKNPEVTRLGYWLRRFKIDELPQLLNVLSGDMSMVGPRPALPSQLYEYDEVGLKRLVVRPGLTGLAQVSGSIHLSWPDRWRYDAAYVDRLSLWLDLWIIWRTFAVVIRGEQKFLEHPDGSRKEGRG